MNAALIEALLELELHLGQRLPKPGTIDELEARCDSARDSAGRTARLVFNGMRREARHNLERAARALERAMRKARRDYQRALDRRNDGVPHE